ncbi:MAG: hypothetical protein KBI32_00335 [Phycisphaerae bacterium]|nr:hypothetical protein [Phycisphaerae bacterium]
MDCNSRCRPRETPEQRDDKSGPVAVQLSRLPAFVPSCLLFLAATLGPICGCESVNDDGMAGAYFLDPSKDLRALGRVALVELDNRSAYPPISEEITEALYLEIQKQQLFGLTVVRQNDPAWRSLQENLDTLQAMRQLVVLRETLRSNGLLLGTITQYQPYPHMVIGLRLKLLDLTDGQLIWATEQVWDSTDRGIQKRIRKYYSGQLKFSTAPLKEELVVVSSLNFCKFVAYEVAATLQPPPKR